MNPWFGICLFSRSVTNPNVDFLAHAVKDAVGTNLDLNFFQQLGREPQGLERQFNLAAGFTTADDELSAFFYNENEPLRQRIEPHASTAPRRMISMRVWTMWGQKACRTKYGRVR